MSIQRVNISYADLLKVFLIWWRESGHLDWEEGTPLEKKAVASADYLWERLQAELVSDN